MASALKMNSQNMAAPIIAAPKGESYWDLVLRQFKKNRLAVCSIFFVASLFLIAIGAPFLANNRPIVLMGAYPGLYKQNYEEWRLGAHPELMSRLQEFLNSSGAPPSDLQARLETVSVKLKFMASQLPSENARTLTNYIAYYAKTVQGAQAGDRAQVAQQMAGLKSIFHEIIVRFSPGNGIYEEKLSFPILEMLSPLDYFFMTLVSQLLLLLVIRRAVSAAWARSWKALVIVVILPAVFFGVLRTAHASVFDTMDYKDQLSRGEIESSLALFPPIPYGINEGHLGDKYHAPNRTYLLGSDGNGRDLLTRMIWGSSISLSVGFVAVAIFVSIGILVGTIAGYFRGWVDIALSRLIEIVICFPAFFLILAVLAFLQPGLLNIMIVIGITGWTTEARLVRGEFLRLADQEFVLAARALGVSKYRIIFRHILPNGLAPLLVAASFGVASAILIESSLSFLGFGISIPVPSWGGILNEARENFRFWWITIFPGLAIFSTVTAYNLIGEGVRDAIDPRLKQ